MQRVSPQRRESAETSAWVGEGNRPFDWCGSHLLGFYRCAQNDGALQSGCFFVLEVTVNSERCFRLRKLHRSNLNAKSKQLRIVLTTRFAPKQGVWRVWHLGKRRQTTMRRVRKSPQSTPIVVLFVLEVTVNSERSFRPAKNYITQIYL